MSKFIGGLLLIPVLAIGQGQAIEDTKQKSIDLPAGTIVCVSRESAKSFVKATAEQNQTQLEWIMSGACAELSATYARQQLIGEKDNIKQIAFSNGRWKLDRFIPQT